jgi:hypothetical protein
MFIYYLFIPDVKAAEIAKGYQGLLTPRGRMEKLANPPLANEWHPNLWEDRQEKQWRQKFDVKEGYEQVNQEQGSMTAAQAAMGQQEEPLPVNPGECFKTMP